MGIEPTRLAWEARALPLSYTRSLNNNKLNLTVIDYTSWYVSCQQMGKDSTRKTLSSTNFQIPFQLPLYSLQSVINRFNVAG